MTDKPRIMQAPPCGPGNHYENISPLGEPPQWVVKPGPIPSIDPSAPPLLFGYEQSEFLAKQYRPGKEPRSGA